MFDFLEDFFENFDFNITFGFPRGDRDTGRQDVRRGRVGGGSQRERRLGALPFPTRGPTSTNPFPSGSTRPPFGTFPTGTVPANDPIFRAASRAARGAGRLLGPIGGLVISAADILVAVISGAQLEGMADILRRQDAAIDELLRRRRKEKTRREFELEVEKKARALEQAPETFDPTVFEQPTAPAPQTGSEVIFPTPSTIFLPTPIGVPGIDQIPSPSPLPDPGVSPAPVPSTQPAGQPDVFGVPAPLPLPQNLPLQLPRLLPRPLTVVDPTSVPSGQPQPVPSFLQDPRSLQDIDPTRAPQLSLAFQQCPAPQRKCDDELDEIRTTCFKGLYREGVRDTTFTEWAEIDCITGVEI